MTSMEKGPFMWNSKKQVKEAQNRPCNLTSNPIFKYLSMLISMKFTIQ